MRRIHPMQRAFVLLLLLPGAAAAQSKEVIVYCSQDEEHAVAIFSDFEKETGIRVRPVFDTEDAKTVGLVNRIIAEAKNPGADVFWNNEAAQSVRLAALGLLEPWVPPNAAGIPETFRDREGHWTGFAARARILLVNTDRLREKGLPAPRSLLDLADPRYKDQVAVARPLTGSTLTHFAALFAAKGSDWTRDFIQRLRANGVFWQSGNGPVMRDVADGRVAVGLTDTDDARVAVLNGRPVQVIYPDQEGSEVSGALVFPNTLMLLRGARHPEEGRRLIDWLLSPAVEEKLAKSRSGQIPLHPDVPVPEGVKRVSEIRAMTVDWKAVAREIEGRHEYLSTTFVAAGTRSLWILGGILAAALIGLGLFTRSRTRKAA